MHAPEGDCVDCLAWYAEAQRAALLLALLAEDHFPDQATFDAWINRQMQIVHARKGEPT
jgi:hypothetical protein